MWNKGKLCTLLVGLLIGVATVENSMEVPQKTKNRIVMWSSNSFSPGYISKENKIIIQKYTGTLMFMNIACLVTQSCLTLCDPLECSLPVSSVHGTFQARILECVAIFLLQIFPTQGLNPHLLCLLHCRRILYRLNHQGYTNIIYNCQEMEATLMSTNRWKRMKMWYVCIQWNITQP